MRLGLSFHFAGGKFNGFGVSFGPGIPALAGFSTTTYTDARPFATPVAGNGEGGAMMCLAQ